MSKRRLVVEYLNQGVKLYEIAQRLNLSVATLVSYLQTNVGQGTIRRSDIYFAIEPELREPLGTTIQSLGTTDTQEIIRLFRLRRVMVDKSLIEIYMQFRDASVSMGDMYEFLAEIEINLHTSIKRVLISSFGSEEGGWWRKGIPQEIRQDCHTMREADPEPATEAYSYTTFIQLSKIIDKQWAIFMNVLPEEVIRSKATLMSNLGRLNGIRNSVMHPVKQIPLTEGDFELVREFREKIRLDRWRF